MDQVDLVCNVYYKNVIIKIYDDNNCSTEDIINSDKDFIKNVYHLFVNDVLFEPGSPIEFAAMARYYVCKNDSRQIKYWLMAIDSGYERGYCSLGIYYQGIKDYDNAFKYWSLGVENESVLCMDKLGRYYYDKKDYVNAKKYFMMASDKKFISSILILKDIYKNIDNDIENYIKYWVIAIENGEIDESNNLGLYFLEKKDYTNAKKYFKIGINHGAAMNNLGHYYYDIKKNREKAKKYFKMASNKGLTCAMINLSNVYKDENHMQKYVKYMEKAITNNDFSKINDLGLYFLSIKDYNNVEKYFTIGVKNGDSGSMNNLGHYHSTMGDNEKAMDYFMMAAKKGCADAMGDIGILHEKYKKYDEMEKYYLMAIEHGCSSIQVINNIEKYYINNMLNIKLLRLYVKYENVYKRYKTIHQFKIMAISLSLEDEKEYCEFLITYKFNDDDILPTGVKLLIKALTDKLTIYDLHFKYSMEGKGYVDAKTDFLNRVCGKIDC